MLQYFSVTGDTVFMCLSFVEPGQDGPLPMLMYRSSIRARPPLSRTAVLAHKVLPKRIILSTYKYNLKYAFRVCDYVNCN